MRWIHGMDVWHGYMVTWHGYMAKTYFNEDTKDPQFPVACTFNQPDVEDHIIRNTSHSSVLAWRIPGTGEPGGLLSMGSHRVRHD